MPKRPADGVEDARGSPRRKDEAEPKEESNAKANWRKLLDRIDKATNLEEYYVPNGFTILSAKEEGVDAKTISALQKIK